MSFADQDSDELGKAINLESSMKGKTETWMNNADEKEKGKDEKEENKPSSPSHTLQQLFEQKTAKPILGKAQDKLQKEKQDYTPNPKKGKRKKTAGLDLSEET